MLLTVRWIATFDESGALILAQDSYDGCARSKLREASESLSLSPFGIEA